MKSVTKWPYHSKGILFSVSVCGHPLKGIHTSVCCTGQDQLLLHMLDPVPKLFVRAKSNANLCLICVHTLKKEYRVPEWGQVNLFTMMSLVPWLFSLPVFCRLTISMSIVCNFFYVLFIFFSLDMG
jgi:hypothetical protein